ncbi:MAG: AtpZ/AtpI family protein [Fibrobacteres bacterium]|nr:AtpZ/AtpI family protein [Fibrobacterota bacterium]
MKFNSSKKYIMLGSNFFAGVGVLSLIGHFIDKRTGGDYAFTLGGAILGLVWAFYEVVKAMILEGKKNDDKTD